MTYTTNVPPPIFGDNGFVPQSEAAILTGVWADLNAAFGGNLNTTNLTTPQGQIATSVTAIIGDSQDQFCALANGVDPALASGRMQDAICDIYYLERNAAVSTVATCLCIGAAGTMIPIGASAIDQGGNIYSCTEAATIGPGGNIKLMFACTTTGPISCPAGYLNRIYQEIPGWDTVSNPTAGVIGNDAETRSDLDFRRAASVAMNAQGSLPAVLGAVFAVPGVLDAYSTENVYPVSVNTGGVSLVPNSLYICAYGGDPTAIAQAIWSKKSPGCNYSGNTTVVVYDSASGYSAPYPSYPVTFQVANPTTVLFSVSMQMNSNVPANAAALIQAAIISAFTGADGGYRARIGATLFASRFYAGIVALGSWAQIYSVQMGFASANQNSLTMGIGQVPVTSAANISVTFS